MALVCEKAMQRLHAEESQEQEQAPPAGKGWGSEVDAMCWEPLVAAVGEAAAAQWRQVLGGLLQVDSRRRWVVQVVVWVLVVCGVHGVGVG